MTQLDHDDIQGFIARGYGHLPEACYLVLSITDAATARAWLADILPLVTPSATKPADTAHHVAFTCAGLRVLGMHDEDLKTFSLPFYQGMASEHRTRVLGDIDESAPGRWRWGGPNTPEVHVLLLLFSRDADTLTAARRSIQEGYRGVTELGRLDTHVFDTPQEHFGFADGIAQPIIEGLSRTGRPENTLPPGEFILGYENAYARLPASPTVAEGRDPDAILPAVAPQRDSGEKGAHDFGRNGSYLVFRQMSQDVHGFWQFIDEAARNIYEGGEPIDRTRLAAKVIGRWPSGAPLIVSGDEDDEAEAGNDAFGYRRDLDGIGCPIGAHIRRTNPRDSVDRSMVGRDASAAKIRKLAAESTKVSNRHRLLRRGRPYGPPVLSAGNGDEVPADQQRSEERGLHFICLNADLARQFEFVQHTWINNTKFGGLYGDADPVVGNHDRHRGTFTIQAEPVRQRIKSMSRFVEVRGGAYFFLPGLRALHFLASL
jgi:Dyp-type peroxidase family